MNIAVIGAGKIGGTLSQKWAEAGHEIRFGVRNPADPKLADLQKVGRVLPVAESLAGAEVALVSLPGAAVMDFAAQHGASLNGKIVIDTTNNVRSPEMNNLAVLQDKAPGAQLVRAFNSLGWENFADPRLGGVQIDLFYCCDAACRSMAEQLIGDVGLRPVYVGDLGAAAIVDGLTRLWLALAMGQGHGRRIAFKMLEEG